jgi:hypothetical protein
MLWNQVGGNSNYPWLHISPTIFSPASLRLSFPWFQVHTCVDKDSGEDSERKLSVDHQSFLALQLSLLYSLFELKIHILKIEDTAGLSHLYSTLKTLDIMLGNHNAHLIDFSLPEIIVLNSLFSRMWQLLFHFITLLVV